MQKVLAEVTEHMEQQYSAHKYLEKLRVENESIALKEKERVVSDSKFFSLYSHAMTLSPRFLNSKRTYG